MSSMGSLHVLEGSVVFHCSWGFWSRWFFRMAFPPSVEKNITHFVKLVFKNQPGCCPWNNILWARVCPPAFLDPAIHGQGEACDWSVLFQFKGKIKTAWESSGLIRVCLAGEEHPFFCLVFAVMGDGIGVQFCIPVICSTLFMDSAFANSFAFSNGLVSLQSILQMHHGLFFLVHMAREQFWAVVWVILSCLAYILQPRVVSFG